MDLICGSCFLDLGCCWISFFGSWVLDVDHWISFVGSRAWGLDCSMFFIVFLGCPAGLITLSARFEVLCFCGGVSGDRSLPVGHGPRSSASATHKRLNRSDNYAPAVHSMAHRSGYMVHAIHDGHIYIMSCHISCNTDYIKM